MDTHPTRPVLEEELHAFADGLLEPGRRLEIQGYLDRQPEAMAFVRTLQAQRQGLREAFRPVVEEPVPSRLNLQRLVEDSGSRRHRWPAWRLAAAVTLTLGLGGAGGWLARGQSEGASAGIASLSKEATSSYAVYASDAAHPVEIDGAHKAELASWIASRLDRRVPVPDLERSGFTLVGGRIVATEHGPAALLMYDDPQGLRIGILARSMAVDRDTGAMAPNRGPYPGFSWADRGLGYSVIGNGDEAKLHPLADEVRRQVRLSL